ncbi:pilus assembly PilX N-terminal domain-containing protein [Lysinibacillus sp. Ag94]|uniref:DUF7305 domain-containing protein n=1 Tax=Lysinibacillus sp. Ag94 TaxID=2936682 RepID=UPI00200E557D|nr:pilus assembly PilX N-terminal domain-containing protein [Lysinibacillus sp. Ag94]UPW84302.1 hypothetical protein MY533_05370 [Lysinibacillus sp. Ag94]
MFKYLKQEKGYSLLLVILAIAFLSVLGIMLLTLTANSLKISTSERDDQSVFYIAEGGLNSTKSKVEQLAKITYDQNRKDFNKLPLDKRKPEKFKLDFIDAFERSLKNTFEENTQSTYTTTVTFDEQFKEKPIANVTIVQENTEPLQYKITSVGSIGKKTRAVAQTITVNLGSGTETGPAFSNAAAIHAIENIVLGGGKFNGDVVSERGNIAIKQDDTKISGKIGTTLDKFSKPDWMTITNEIIGNVAFPEDMLPPFPDNQFTILSTRPYTKSIQVTIGGERVQHFLKNNSIEIDGDQKINGEPNFSGILPISQDMYVKTLMVASNNTLTIDVGNSDKNLFIDNFHFSQGHLKIIGSGKLTLYLKNAFDLKGDSSMNNTGDIGQLSVYYAGTSPMDFTGNTRTKASIYAKSTNINIDGSGSVQGNIYTGGSNITIEGGSYNHNLYIYAPNAKVILGGSGTVVGGIMAHTVKTSGAPAVTYKAKTIEDTISNGGLIFEENNNLTISNGMLEVD